MPICSKRDTDLLRCSPPQLNLCVMSSWLSCRGSRMLTSNFSVWLAYETSVSPTRLECSKEAKLHQVTYELELNLNVM